MKQLISLCKLPFWVLVCGMAAPTGMYGQNLVRNPGFEQTNPGVGPSVCNYPGLSADGVHTFAKSWTTFSNNSPDYWLLDSTRRDCRRFRAHSGRAAVGLILYFPKEDTQNGEDYHEYVQGTIDQALQPGQVYRFSVWVYTNNRVGPEHPAATRGVYGAFAVGMACNNLGVAFLPEKTGLTKNYKEWFAQNKPKPAVQFTQLMSPDGQWQLLSDTFRVSQPCSYFLIGNFVEDAQTKAEMLPGQKMPAADDLSVNINLKKRIGYYLLDDLAIEPYVYTPPASVVAAALETQKRYTFQAKLLFATGKSDLQPAAGGELGELADYLKAHPKIKIEVGGHSDNTGQVALNQKLSEQRALAVKKFLLEKGVAAEQISTRGYGPAKPVADNGTEDGRQQNRRVEVVVTD